MGRFWGLATDALTPQQATELGEDLGVEWDTAEHAGWRGASCACLRVCWASVDGDDR